MARSADGGGGGKAEGVRPQVFMIGGPNGAGKTTASLVLLPQFLDIFEFVNADEIANKA